MFRIRLAFALLATLAGLACGGPTVVGTDRPAVDAWLIWSSDQGGTRTVWLDATGSRRGEADGLVVSRDDQLYALTTEAVPVPVTSCEVQNGTAADASATPEPTAEAAAPNIATRLVLEPRTGDGEPIEILAAPIPEQGGDNLTLAEHQHGAAIVAGVGPYLFVSESTYVYSCGAHGVTGAAARTVEIEHGQTVTLIDGLDTSAARARARDQLAADKVEGDLVDATDPATELALVASVPAWTATGVVMKHLFTIDACYACSDGLWSSYSRGTWVEDPALPVVFALMPPVPTPVIEALLAMPEPRGVSWGRAGARWSAVLPAPRTP